MKKLFLLSIACMLLSLQVTYAQLFEYKKEKIDNRQFEDVCIEYVRDVFNVGDKEITILGMTHYPLPNGNTFVFLRFKWVGITYYEEHQVPGSLVWSSNKNETIYQRHQLEEARRCAVVVNPNGFVNSWFKIPDNFSIWKLSNNILCFLVDKSVSNSNMTFYNSLKCLDYNGDLVWEPENDFMAFDLFKTDNHLYVAGKKVGDEVRSLIRGYEIKTGKVVIEKIGNKGGVCYGLEYGEDGISYTENVNNTSKQFSIPLEANDIAEYRRKIMSRYNQNDASDQVAIGERYLKGKGFDKDEKKAFEWFQKAANQNNSEGLFQLAKCYQKGIGVNQDKAKAITYYEKSVSLNNTNAILALSNMYANGDGVEKNMSKALSLKEKLAFEGNVDAQRFVLSNQSIEYTKVNLSADKFLSHARESYKNRNYEWAKLCYERAINLGNNDAMYDYGLWLYEGIGITKDCYKAIDYLSKLGEGNNLDAQKLLINIYKDNKGIVPDAKQEMYWRMKAADNGDIESQLKLATAYRNGIGVKKNKKLAFEMLSRAAYNGNEDAIYQVVICYATGYGVKKDLDYSVIWAKKLSQKKMFEVAHAFENGIGLKANSSVAMMLYEFLASQNHFNATVSLSRLYISLGYYKDAEKTIGSIDRITNISYSTRESETYYLMGLLRESERRFQDALSCYKNSSKPEAKQCYDRLYSWWKRNNFPSR